MFAWPAARSRPQCGDNCPGTGRRGQQMGGRAVAAARTAGALAVHSQGAAPAGSARSRAERWATSASVTRSFRAARRVSGGGGRTVARRATPGSTSRSAFVNCPVACGAAIIGTPSSSPSPQPPIPAWVTKASALQDRLLRDPGVHLNVGRDVAGFPRIGVLADLEDHVPAGPVVVGPQALAVELRSPGVRRAQADQQHALHVRRAGPAVRARQPVEAGPAEGHLPVSTWSACGCIARRDERQGPCGRAGEGVPVGGGRPAVGARQAL